MEKKMGLVCSFPIAHHSKRYCRSSGLFAFFIAFFLFAAFAFVLFLAPFVLYRKFFAGFEKFDGAVFRGVGALLFEHGLLDVELLAFDYVRLFVFEFVQDLPGLVHEFEYGFIAGIARCVFFGAGDEFFDLALRAVYVAGVGVKHRLFLAHGEVQQYDFFAHELVFERLFGFGFDEADSEFLRERSLFAGVIIRAGYLHLGEVELAHGYGFSDLRHREPDRDIFLLAELYVFGVDNGQLVGGIDLQAVDNSGDGNVYGRAYLDGDVAGVGGEQAAELGGEAFQEEVDVLHVVIVAAAVVGDLFEKVFVVVGAVAESRY